MLEKTLQITKHLKILNHRVNITLKTKRQAY